MLLQPTKSKQAFHFWHAHDPEVRLPPREDGLSVNASSRTKIQIEQTVFLIFHKKADHQQHHRKVRACTYVA